MNNELLAIVVNQVVIPEAIKAIGRLMDRGAAVTPESVRAELDFNADRAIMNGTAWLAANPQTP